MSRRNSQDGKARRRAEREALAELAADKDRADRLAELAAVHGLALLDHYTLVTAGPPPEDLGEALAQGLLDVTHSLTLGDGEGAPVMFGPASAEECEAYLGGLPVEDRAVPCPTCRVGWVDGAGVCDEPGCPGLRG